MKLFTNFTCLKLLFALYFYKATVLHNVQCTVNHSEAMRLCKDKGGLASSSLFPRVEVTLSDYGQPHGSVLYSQLVNVNLEDGQSAWVAGYAIYGEFYNHMGCYDDNGNTFEKSDKPEHRGFYQCSKYCETFANGNALYDNFYISIDATRCFCLRDCQPEKRTACPNNTNNRNGLVELYQKRDRYTSHGPYQCVFMRLNVKDHWVETTSKCHDIRHIACSPIQRPFVCNDIPLSNSLYCDVHYSATWVDCIKHCNNFKTMMASHQTEKLKSIMKKYNEYWLGAVSAYTIQVESGDACLAVTGLGDQLVLEPDDCQTENNYICASDIINNNDDKHAATSAGTHTVIIIVVCCLVLAAVVATSFLFYKHKRPSHKGYCKPLITQLSSNLSGDQTANVADSVYATVDENEMVRPESGDASEFSDTGNLPMSIVNDDTLDRKTPPDNHARHALRMKSTDYKDTEANKSDEYNVLSYYQPAKPARKPGGETNVYNHMSAIPINYHGSNDNLQNALEKNGQNEYDTTKNVKVLLHGDYATAHSLK